MHRIGNAIVRRARRDNVAIAAMPGSGQAGVKSQEVTAWRSGVSMNIDG